MTETVIKVALATPLDRLFDYRAPAGGIPQAGQRVKVPFGRREQTGIIVDPAGTPEVAADRLRTADQLLDAEPLLDKSLMEMLAWAAAYYQHPPGEVYAAALPASLRRGASASPARDYEWRITSAGLAADRDKLARSAGVQAAILTALAEAPCNENELRAINDNWRKVVATLIDKGWVEQHEAASPPPTATVTGPVLTEAQQTAVENIPAEGFHPCLLEGVTGSGKTEVYLRLIEAQLAAGRQSLVLVPEIGLTPQLIERFEERVAGTVAALHSGLTDTRRLNAWLEAREGKADVIIGTRSAIFCPLPRAGLIIVDEEHDSSYKQQDGFRYSARDLAVFRSRQLDIPVVLGSATPAFETLQNALAGRYRHLQLPARPGSARQPDLHTIDLRQHPLQEGLSRPLIEAMRRHLEDEGQVLLYLNRRGFAPVLLCPGCGEVQECNRCDARMVLHQRRNRLACHHCGAERALPETCPDCDKELIPVGLGTERLEEQLGKLFPDYPLVRIDRDTTRRRGAMEAMLKDIRAGKSRILLGTQMLTKGHDFPNVTCVGIIDSDQGLFGTDFRSSERLAQSLLQVAGRAGRGDRPGEVWVQTWYPDHPLLQTLLQRGYGAFAREALGERDAAGWPPFSHIALLRAEAPDREQLFSFLEAARRSAAVPDGIRLLGPASSPMERRSGRYRGQLLVQSADRQTLGRFLRGWRATVAGLQQARRTRWSLDIDPVELF